MRQANFPDRKALTARDVTCSKPSQASTGGLTGSSCNLFCPSGSGAQAVTLSSKTFPKPYHRHHCFGHACGRPFSPSSEPSPPYAKLSRGWSRLGTFLRATCHCSHDCFLTSPVWVGGSQPPFLPGPPPGGSWWGRRPPSVSTAVRGWEHKGMCRE